MTGILPKKKETNPIWTYDLNFYFSFSFSFRFFLIFGGLGKRKRTTGPISGSYQKMGGTSGSQKSQNLVIF
jgi:hypothetical protein